MAQVRSGLGISERAISEVVMVLSCVCNNGKRVNEMS